MIVLSFRDLHTNDDMDHSTLLARQNTQPVLPTGVNELCVFITKSEQLELPTSERLDLLLNADNAISRDVKNMVDDTEIREKQIRGCCLPY